MTAGFMALWGDSNSISPFILFIFFFIDPSTTEIYTLSLHDALPILNSNASRFFRSPASPHRVFAARWRYSNKRADEKRDRKSTRLNSSHVRISYAVFCLKKKNEIYQGDTVTVQLDCSHA